MGKCFGLFPINISSNQPHDVKFQWKSFKSAFSSVFVLCSITTACISVKAQMDMGPLKPSNMNGIIFFGTCAVISLLFMKIARKWRFLMMRWSSVEAEFLCEKYELPATRWKLKKKILVFLVISLILAFTEHFLSIVDGYNKLYFEISYCNITNYDPFEIFIKKYLGFVASRVPFGYNNFIGIIVEYLNISYTFYWNYLDIFTILISIGMSDLFERLNYRLESLKSLHVDEITW